MRRSPLRTERRRHYFCRGRLYTGQGLPPGVPGAIATTRLSGSPQARVLGIEGELVQEHLESGGFAIELKAHRSIVPSPSAVQTKCGTCPGATSEGVADVGGPSVDDGGWERISTTERSHRAIMSTGNRYVRNHHGVLRMSSSTLSVGGPTSLLKEGLRPTLFHVKHRPL